MNSILRIAHSPDPDDAFMFFGFAEQAVKIFGYTIEHVLNDIQSLNQAAFRSEFEVTAISAHAFPYVSDKYWIMKTGASMGEGYGPVIISKKAMNLSELSGKRIAHPGEFTTATLLLRLYTEGCELISYPFDKIMDAVEQGDVDAGVIIHEGQITYESLGFKKVIDFGELWMKEYSLPLPLGLDCVRKDMGIELAHLISKKLKESIEYGYSHLDAATEYAMKYGRGLNRQLGERFVRMYVSELTIDMGMSGKAALDILFQRAAEKKIIPAIPPIELV